MGVSETTGASRWLAAAVAAAALFASFLWSADEFPKLPLCWLRRLTGVSCPGCGLTRSFCALSHADFGSAWSFHPFGIAFYLLAIALVAWPFAARRWPALVGRVGSSRWLVVVAIGFVVALFGFGIARAWAEVAAR
ncbi:MAG: DUF2752 domain-containing protein [Planctomycetes bacterium]|nr:DUF2752 domain-containing protein [Planctomycetota bacterium]